ncbi:S8 family serine peptidase [Mariniluteicoccus endophyticus]
MKFNNLRRAGVVAAAAAVMVLPAVAANASPNASTPVPVDMSDGRLMSYVVNTKANPGQVRLAERAITKSGGAVVQSWPQIGVVIAHSTKADFLKKVRAQKAVESAGPTRTTPVVEGTPGQSNGHKGGASGYKKKAEMLNGDAEGAASPAAAGDPMETEQWDMTMIKADQAHKITDGSRNVLVGVLDSGIDPEHPDLKPNIDVAASVNCTGAGQPSAKGWEPTTSDHGTHVAGTIAAARNGVGMVGVAPNVRMASVKVVSDDGFIYPEYAICGFVQAAEKNMDVTNNSYFVDPFEFWCGDQADQAPAKEAVRRAVAYSTGKGVVHAAAAGNNYYDLANKTTDEGSPNDSTPVERQINSTCHDIPAELPGVLTVSAIDKFGEKAPFSNYGEGVIDVGAPGRAILSTLPGGKYGPKSGTSMASPHAAGVLALLKSTHPDATPAQLIDMIKKQADDHACPTAYPTADQQCTGPVTNNGFYGEGMIDALDAVTR